MKIASNFIHQLVIEGVQRLDPVRVTWENYELGQGRITVTCYGRAWTAAWFAMGGKTIEQFFVSADAGYILGNMTGNMAAGLQRNKKNDESYLLRIIVAVQEGLRQHLKGGAQ